MKREHYNHESVLRRKLDRWKFHRILEGTLARRAARVLHTTFQIVPLRVALVLLRTWFNGWCTARRFQAKQSRCLIGCAPNIHAEHQDSIEHYAYCPVIVHFATHHLYLSDSEDDRLLQFLCLRKNMSHEEQVVRMLLLYAVYTATNMLRYNRPRDSTFDMAEFLMQLVHQGASQMRATQRALHDHRLHRRMTRARRTHD